MPQEETMSDPMPKRYKLSDAELKKLQANDDYKPRFEFLEKVAPLSADDLECMNEIRDVLKRRGKSERFGVTLLHKHFELESDETLVETTDSKARAMVLQPAIIDPSDTSAIDTQWYLGGNMPLSLVKCRTRGRWKSISYDGFLIGQRHSEYTA
jgi:hypothetical protein